MFYGPGTAGSAGIAGFGFSGIYRPVATELDKPGVRDAEEPECPAGQEDPELAGDPGPGRDGPECCECICSFTLDPCMIAVDAGDPFDPDVGHETETVDHEVADRAWLVDELSGLAPLLRDQHGLAEGHEWYSAAGHGRPPLFPAGVLCSGRSSSAVRFLLCS